MVGTCPGGNIRVDISALPIFDLTAYSERVVLLSNLTVISRAGLQPMANNARAAETTFNVEYDMLHAVPSLGR